MKKMLILLITLILLLPLSTAITLQMQEELTKKSQVPVIITLKDPSQISKYKNSFGKMSVSEKKELKTSIKEEVKAKIDKTKIKHEYESFNGFSTKLTEQELLELENNEMVASIEYDLPLQKSLQTSTVVINATTTWPVQENGVNLTGLGQTICIIDTGINYTHESLGGCTIKNTTVTGNNESYGPLETPHYYLDNYVYNYSITKTGYTSIAVHFSILDTEAHYDYVYILDADNNTVANYSGYFQNLWSPNVSGDTINIRLVSDEAWQEYGFIIDQTLNGSAITTYNWSECTKVINGWDYVNNDEDPYDDDGHGTHVAGTAAGTNKIKGVAPDANLVAIKTLDEDGNGTLSDAIAGVEWCINKSSEYNISVISMSLGGGLYSNYCDASFTSFATSINLAVASNISVIVATGNSASSTSISTPACIQNSTRVGRTSNDDTIHANGNRGANFNILMAPGTDINSTCIGGDYCLNSGTSMSTPHVAGAAAILQQLKKLQNNTMLTKFELENALNSTGKQVYDAASGKNYSRIDIYSSTQSLDESTPELNITKNSSTIFYNVSSIAINWTATDNLGISTSIFNITFPNGTILFSSTSTNSSIELTKENLSELGFYNISFWSNDTSGNQNSENDSFEVVDSSPIIVSYEPETENYTLYLGQNLSFNISTQDPLGNPLYYYWYINSTLVNQSENYTLNSSNYYEDNFSVELVVSNNNSNASNTWNIEILYPYVQIDTYDPNSSPVNIRKNKTMIFNHTSSDPLGRQVYYSWFLNGTLNSTSQNYTFNTTNFNISYYNLTLIITNNDSNASVEWNVSVLEANNPVEFNSSMNITDYSWVQNNNLGNAFLLTNYFHDLDGENLTYTLINASNMTLSVTNNYASFLPPASFYGTEYVWIVANDSESNASSNVFRLTVTQAPASPPSGGGGGGGGGGGSTPSEENDTDPILNLRTPLTKLNEYTKTFEKAENKIEIKTSNDLLLETLNILFRGTHNNVEFKIINRENINTENFTGKKHYKGFEITHSNLDNIYIDNATLKFKVEKKWIQENNVNFLNIALFRQEDGYWNELKTEYLTDDLTYNYYKSESPRLSIFLIGEKQEEIKKEEIIPEQNEFPEEKNMISELLVKIIAAIFSVAAILLVIIIIDKIARKKALKMKEQLEKEQSQESVPPENKN